MGFRLGANVKFHLSRGTLRRDPTAQLCLLETTCALGSEDDCTKDLDGIGCALDAHPRALGALMTYHPAHSSATQYIPDPGHPGIHGPPLHQPLDVIWEEERIPEQRLLNDSHYSRRGRTAVRGDCVPDFEKVLVKDGQSQQGDLTTLQIYVLEMHVIIQAVHLVEELCR